VIERTKGDISMESSELLTTARQRDVSSSGVSWGAVIGGAFVTAALSLIMLALGAGFGLSAISPWSNIGASASTVGTVGIIWLVVTQVIASSMGGYLAGRLRTRWHTLHNDEVHFRDTANGFLAWAVAVVVTVAFLASAATSMAGGAASSSEVSMATRAAEQGDGLAGNAYFVDRLFRADHHGATEADTSVRAEAGRIVANALRRKEGSASDASYLAQLVAAKTGLNPNDAEKRVSETMADARQTVDSLRSLTARILLWTFLALLMGAFCASYAATIGGRQRDHVQAI
jgi:hypothetical protein